MNILEKICKEKKIEVERLKSSIDYKKKLKISDRRKFLETLRKKKKINII